MRALGPQYTKMVKPLDLVGQRFAQLHVVARAENGIGSKARFFCECDCGSTTTVYGTHLVRGMTKSCGCYRVQAPKDAFTKHGMRRSPEYRAWCHMKTRCLNENAKYHHRYGGRGIEVCSEWLNSFEAFYRHMGPRPSSRHSVDRRNNDKSYEPGNCHWALPDVQAANRSSVKWIEHNGVRDTIAGWARRTGIPYLKLRRRIVDGWSVARAIEAKDCAVRARLYVEPTQ